MKTYSNPRNVVPKYEAISKDKEYAITLNPDDAHQYFNSPKRLEVFQSKNRLHLENIIGESALLKLQLEVSSHGRLHFHGWLKVVDPMLFYIYVIHQLEEYSTVVIKEIQDDEWTKYVNKQGIRENYIYIPIRHTPKEELQLIIKKFKKENTKSLSFEEIIGPKD